MNSELIANYNENMTDGITYFLAGDRRAAQLTVSLYSLRKFWNGSITVIAADDAGEETAHLLARDSRLDIQVMSWRPPGRVRGKGGWQTTKTWIPELTPYSRTVFLDTDTLVIGNIDALFPEDDEVRVTQFSDWVTTGSIVRSRIEAWRKELPDEVALMSKVPHPALNTGVFGITKSANLFAAEWKHVTHLNPRFMGDEIVCNLIFTKYPHKLLDHRWNFSPKFSLEPGMPPWSEADARIVHFHGFSHCRPSKTQFGTDLWMPWYEQAMSENIGGIADWGPGKDKHLKIYVNSLSATS